MNLMRTARTYRGAQIAFALARCLPRRTAYAVSDQLFGRVIRQPDAPFMRGIRANLAVAYGLPPIHPDLDRAVRRVLVNAGRSYVDFVQAAARGRNAVADCCRLSPSLYSQLEQAAISERGLVVVGAHTCGFDFVLAAMGRWCPDLIILSQEHPTGSSVLMNDLRRRLGLHLAPVSPGALRDALTVLRRGGMVGIAADVPVFRSEPLTFFGAPACLPAGYARLALSADADLVLGLCHRDGPSRYEVVGEPVPRPAGSQNHRRAAQTWAQVCLQRLEAYLRLWLDEWLMPQPIWEARMAGPQGHHGPGMQVARADPASTPTLRASD